MVVPNFFDVDGQQIERDCSYLSLHIFVLHCQSNHWVLLFYFGLFSLFFRLLVPFSCFLIGCCSVIRNIHILFSHHLSNIFKLTES